MLRKLLALTIIIAAPSLLAKEVSSLAEFREAIGDACEGKSVDAECTISFPGGSVTVGICVELPDEAGTGFSLVCELDTDGLKENCKNNAFGSSPGSLMTWGSLFGLLAFLRRRRNA